MRQLSIPVVAVILVKETAAVAKCSSALYEDGSNPSFITTWFDNLNYCARYKYDHTPNTLYTATTLGACVSARPTGSTTDYPNKNSNLVTVLAGASACPSCAVDYANAVVDLYVANSDFLSVCGETLASTASWTDTDPQDSFDSPECVRFMYDPLTNFNACAGKTEDLRTGSTSTRCTYNEFYEWETKYRPLGEYITNEVLIATSSHAPSDCASCMEDFLTEVPNAVSGDCDEIDETCLSNSNLQAALDTMTVCTGGSAFRTGSEILPHRDLVTDANVVWGGEICSDLDVLYMNVYEPFAAYVACASEIVDIDNTMAFDACVADIIDIPSLSDFGCGKCLTNLALEIKANMDETCTSEGPFDAACIASLTGNWKPIDNFYYCAGSIVDGVEGGVVMGTFPTQCVDSRIERIAPEFRSYVPILEAVLDVDDIELALDVIYESIDSLQNEIAGITCESCYKRLGGDIYQLSVSDELLSVVCGINPYSADCAKSIAEPLATFETCSGFEATATSPYVCTADEVSVIASEEIVASLLNLAGSSLTTEQAVHTVEDSLAEIDSESPFLCSHCFMVAMRALKELSDSDLAACKSDLESSDCEFAFGNELRSFWSCSGFEFALTPVAATTTAPVRTTTVAGTTETASTTTKSTAIALASTLGLLAFV